MCKILLGQVTDSATGTVTPLARAPTIATTLSISTNFLAALVAGIADVSLSSWISLMFNPAAFSCFAASTQPFFRLGPNSLSGPVWERSVPTFNSWARAPEVKARAKMNTIAIDKIFFIPTSFLYLHPLFSLLLLNHLLSFK